MLDIVVYTSTQNISLIFCWWKIESHIVLYAMQDKNWFQLAETDSINSHKTFFPLFHQPRLINTQVFWEAWLAFKNVVIIALFSLFYLDMYEEGLC